MKKSMLLVLIAWFGGSLAAKADENQAKKLSLFEKEQIAWALRVLSETKTLVVEPNQCVQFDQDILSVLDSAGLIEAAGTRPQTICIGPTEK